MKTYTDSVIKSHRAKIDQLVASINSPSSSPEAVKSYKLELKELFFNKDTDLGFAIFQDICGTRKSSEVSE